MKNKQIKFGVVHNSYDYSPQGEVPIVHESKNIFVKHVFDRTADTWRGMEDVYRRFVVCAIVNVTKDFDPFSDDLIQVNSDTDSFQYRPKLIYKDTKGYFYKPYGKVVRLNEAESVLLEEFVTKYSKA